MNSSKIIELIATKARMPVMHSTSRQPTAQEISAAEQVLSLLSSINLSTNLDFEEDDELVLDSSETNDDAEVVFESSQ